jgi:cell division protein FtsL
MNRLIEGIFGLGVFLIPIAAIVIGGIISVTSMILKHQERIAKIERGIDPDAPASRV